MTVAHRRGSKNYHYEFEVDGQRYRRSTGTADEAAALEIEAAARRAVMRKRDLHGQGLRVWTVGDVAEEWLAAARAIHGDHNNDASRVRKLFGLASIDGQPVRATYIDAEGRTAPRFALDRDLPFHALTQGLLLRLRDARLLEGNAAATINREMALVQSFVGFASAHGVATPQPPLNFSARHNKMAALKLREPAGKLRFLSLAEESQLLAALGRQLEASRARGATKAFQDQLDLCIFLLDTGARYSEVAKITWDVIDLDREEFDLQRSKRGSPGRLRMTQRLKAVLERRRIATTGRRHVFPGSRGGKQWAEEDVPRGHATRPQRPTTSRVRLGCVFGLTSWPTSLTT